MDERYFVFRINAYGVCAEICADASFYADVSRLRQLFSDERMLDLSFNPERFTRILYMGALTDADEWYDVCQGDVLMRVEALDAGEDEHLVACSPRMVINKDGFTLGIPRGVTTYSSNHIPWLAIGADKSQDLLRCRYFDCVEAHPTAADNELVTCHTCRKDLGLAR
jgi:hypothetical protein